MQLRWAVVACAALSIYFNHYARDCPGALQAQLSESPLFLTDSQYGQLNSWFFFPNIMSPIIAGVLSQWYGGARTFIGVCAIAAFGQILFGLGAQRAAFPLMVAGRLISGIAYEAVDIVPTGVIAPLVTDCWDAVSGCANGFLRMGSVTNFILTPWIYNHAGLIPALWVASIFGALALPLSICMKIVCDRIEKQKKEKPAAEKDTFEQQTTVSLSDFSSGYWVYVLCAIFVYGSIVPFWFFASKFIQQKWGYSLQAADGLTLLPEGIITLVAPTMGTWVVDKSWPIRKRMWWCGGGCALTSVVYFLFAWTYITPVVLTFLVGFGYSLSNFFLWSCLGKVSPPKQFGLSACFIGCAANLLPGILPFWLASLPPQQIMVWLGVIAAMSAAFGFLAGVARHQVVPLELASKEELQGREDPNKQPV